MVTMCLPRPKVACATCWVRMDMDADAYMDADFFISLNEKLMPVCSKCYNTSKHAREFPVVSLEDGMDLWTVQKIHAS